MSQYYKSFKKNKYLYLNKFFNKKDMLILRKIINNIEKNKLTRLSKSFNNGLVALKSRYQILLYIIKYNVYNLTNKPIIDSYFQYIYNSLSFIIIEPIIDLFHKMNIKDIKLCRMTIMYVCPGNPIQEIHVDDIKDKKMFYIAIPLHDTPLKMGPIVLFSHKNTKQYLNHGKLTFGLLENNPKLIKHKIQKKNDLGDIIFWTNYTLHYGDKNRSNKIRKYLFLILSSDKNRFFKYSLCLDENKQINVLDTMEYVTL